MKSKPKTKNQIQRQHNRRHDSVIIFFCCIRTLWSVDVTQNILGSEGRDNVPNQPKQSNNAGVKMQSSYGTSITWGPQVI